MCPFCHKYKIISKKNECGNFDRNVIVGVMSFIILEFPFVKKFMIEYQKSV